LPLKQLFTYKKYWIVFAAWFLLWPFAQTYLLLQYGIESRLAWADSLLSNLLLALACFDSTFILRYYHTQRKVWYLPLLWSAGLAAVSLIVMNFSVIHFYAAETGYLLFFQQTIPLRFVIGFIIIGAFILLDRLLYYIRIQEEENKRKLDLEKLGKDAELAMLRQQLQPHFLFNTLNSISALLTSQPEQARKMIHQLSDFLRGTVKKDDQQFVDLASELKQLELYLNIEKVRFGQRLHTVIEYDETCLALHLPPLLLQPLLENAIKFGLYDTTDEVTIRLSAKTENRQLLVLIENPFDPDTARPKQGTGFGLSSVQRRLYLLFSRNDLLQTRVNGTVFSVIVKIPQHL